MNLASIIVNGITALVVIAAAANTPNGYTVAAAVMSVGASSMSIFRSMKAMRNE